THHAATHHAAGSAHHAAIAVAATIATHRVTVATHAPHGPIAIASAITTHRVAVATHGVIAIATPHHTTHGTHAAHGTHASGAHCAAAICSAAGTWQNRAFFRLHVHAARSGDHRTASIPDPIDGRVFA